MRISFRALWSSSSPVGRHDGTSLELARTNQLTDIHHLVEDPSPPLRVRFINDETIVLGLDFRSPDTGGGIPSGVLDIIKRYGGFHGSLSWHYNGPGDSLRNPCIKGPRIDVATVLGRFAAGDKVEEILEDYQLTRDQVMSALAYATHVAEHLPPAVKSA